MEPRGVNNMTIIPHAEKARSTAAAVVRVAKEGQLDQELVQQIAGAITEAALKGQMSCTLKYEKWDKEFNEKVDDSEAYLMLGMGYMGRKYIDTNNALVLEIEWK